MASLANLIPRLPRLQFVHRSAMYLLFGPLLFLAIVGYTEQANYRVLALCIWMILWWITEVVPIPITSLLPLITLPWLDIFSFSEAATSYANPIIYLFLGGFLLGLSIEKYNLHKRLALAIIYRIGLSKNRLLLGFMLTSAALSMWISNTATTIMMLPIVISVLSIVEPDGSIATTAVPSAARAPSPAQDASKKGRFAFVLLLATAYGANIGGIATLIGTPTNLVLAASLEQSIGLQFSFLSWFAFAFPISVSVGLICYLFLKFFLQKDHQQTATQVGRQAGTQVATREYLLAERKKLGKITRPEWCVLAVFALVAGAWILRRSLNEIFHWSVTDSGIALLGGLLLFALPYQIKEKKLVFLLEWQDSKRLAWGILLLFGGGLCMARALAETGLILGITQWLPSEGNLLFLLLAFTFVALFLTEFMSNVALISIYIPILLVVSETMAVGPLFLTVPATLAASCAYMLPISTPPNAIVFSSGRIAMRNMVQVGFWLNIFSLLLISIMCYYFFRSFPNGLQI